MRFEYSGAAVAEVDEALAYYRAIDSNLSKRMVLEIEDALNLIQKFPMGWHPLDGGLRQRRLKSFPYVVVYAVRSDVIAVVAFASTHRRPGYWRDRL
jgi:toxin ParE2